MNIFKCKFCGKILTKSGKDYGSNLRFFTCINKGGCINSVWIDIKTRIDTKQHKYEEV